MLLTICVILAGGILLQALCRPLRIPDVAVALGFGLALGPISRLVAPPPAVLSTSLFSFGAAVILFAGGRQVQAAVVKGVWRSIVLLSTVGVLMTAAVMAVALHVLVGLAWPLAAVGAALLAPTDPATLIPVLQHIPVLPRVSQTVESESAFNDATGAAIMGSLVIWAQTGHLVWWQPLANFLWSAVLGIGIGGILGWLALWSVAHPKTGILRDLPSIAALLAALTAFAVPAALGGSGFMGAFVAGLVFGNGELLGWKVPRARERLVNHSEAAMTELLRILVFVLLGIQTRLSWIYPVAGVGLAVAVILMVVARPLTVWAGTLPDAAAHWHARELAFFMWTRETGVVPAILLVGLLSDHLGNVSKLAGVTLEVIVVTILLQASTTGIWAERLGLLVPARAEPDV